MIVLKGKHGEAIVYNDYVDNESQRQILTLLNHPMAKGANIRIMPDVHAGAGCVIGYTAKLTDYIVPNLIGVDIGCGVISLQITKKEIPFHDLDQFIAEHIPTGQNIHNRFDWKTFKYVMEHLLIRDADLTALSIEKVAKSTGQNPDYIFNSLGTLGGGNHFIEVEEGRIHNYLTIHTGSRNFGLKIAKYHQKIAEKTGGISFEEWQNILNDIRQKYKGKEIEAKIKEVRANIKTPKGLEYLTGEQAKAYIEDMKVAQLYAKINRRMILIKIVQFLESELGIKPEVFAFESVHNYINFNDKIVRKGAISAHKKEAVVIPMNMKFGIVIGKGKGKTNWNWSAPHGAGRKFSRGQAKEILSVEAFKQNMDGVYSSCINRSTLDESPMAYKDPKEVIEYLKETVDIIDIAKSLYCFKDVPERDYQKKNEVNMQTKNFSPAL